MSHVHHQSIGTAISRELQVGESFAGSVKRLARGALDTVLLWQERASERHHLASLSEHHLRDIALTRADVEAEITKSFWRA